MRVRILCPERPGSRRGNRVTAERWAGILRALGHRVTIDHAGRVVACDLVLALHAKLSAKGVAAYRRLHPEAGVVVALTGTDVYRDLRRSPAVLRTLRSADRIIALQALAARELPSVLRSRVRVIHQSVSPTATPARRSEAGRFFEVAVVGHLRPEKDPFRPALAVRDVPGTSRIRVTHAGAALTSRMERRALRESARNPRWRWVGELSRGRARRLMALANLVVLPSRMEGGAHVVSEAAVDAVPLIASRIPGTIGLLGDRYPGYFTTGDTARLRALLLRAERDDRFRSRLGRSVAARAFLFDPARETRAFEDLLAELEDTPR